MAVLIVMCDTVVRRAAIEERYPGGWKGFSEHFGGRDTFVTDGELVLFPSMGRGPEPIDSGFSEHGIFEHRPERPGDIVGDFSGPLPEWLELGHGHAVDGYVYFGARLAGSTVDFAPSPNGAECEPIPLSRWYPMVRSAEGALVPSLPTRRSQVSRWIEGAGPKGEGCQHCQYYTGPQPPEAGESPSAEALGTCHRHPPRMESLVWNDAPGFPQTHPDGHCPEFGQRESPTPANLKDCASCAFWVDHEANVRGKPRVVTTGPCMCPPDSTGTDQGDWCGDHLDGASRGSLLVIQRLLLDRSRRLRNAERSRRRLLEVVRAVRANQQAALPGLVQSLRPTDLE